MKKESSIGNSKEINKILEKNFIFLRSTLCLYFAFNQVNIEDIYRALSNANLTYIFAAFITTFVTFILRSLRWKILLDSPKI